MTHTKTVTIALRSTLSESSPCCGHELTRTEGGAEPSVLGWWSCPGCNTKYRLVRTGQPAPLALILEPEPAHARRYSRGADVVRRTSQARYVPTHRAEVA